MKTLLSLLLICACLGAVPCGAVDSVPTHSGEGAFRWYVKRNDEHKTPTLPSEFSFLSEHDGWYCDTAEHPEKKLYLTFDAGYENGNISKILDILREEEVPAAFFVLEHLVTANTDLVTRMNTEGHLVCNHTATHRRLTGADRASFEAELRRMEDVYRATVGEEIAKYYRPPEGTFTRDHLIWAKEMGYKTVFWSFAYADWSNDKQPDPKAAIQKIRNHTHPGEVILLHPTSATNAGILRELIRGWRADGYRFGTLHELTREK